MADLNIAEYLQDAAGMPAAFVICKAPKTDWIVRIFRETPRPQPVSETIIEGRGPTLRAAMQSLKAEVDKKESK